MNAAWKIGMAESVRQTTKESSRPAVRPTRTDRVVQVAWVAWWLGMFAGLALAKYGPMLG